VPWLFLLALGAIQGIVVDTRGGAPISDVAVRLQATGQRVVTDASGRFRFDNVTPGDHELYVSAVDFILVKRAVRVGADDTVEVTIALSEGTGTYTESVDVRATAAPSARAEPSVAAAQSLTGRELQALRGVLANDPLRAVQMLPAVAASDDFRSEFAIRGAGLPQMSFAFEGISTPFLLHTVQQVHDSGSVAMVNGDVVEEIAVSYGSYPQRFGNRTGPEIGFRLREGSRDRVQSHLAVSAIDASAVAEGPIGGSKRGSWLFTARKSYLDLLVDRLYPDQNISFGFVDSQAKFVYDLTPRHRIQVSTTGGLSTLKRKPDTLGAGNLRDADNRSIVSVMTWRYLPSPRFTLEQRVAVVDNDFTNSSRDGAELDGGSARDILYRADASVSATPSALVGVGGEIRRATASEREQRLAAGRFQSRENFASGATDASVYGQVRLGDVARASITPGIRVDSRTLTDTVTVSPWVQASLALSHALMLRTGAGIYRQEPQFNEVLGLRGNPSLGVQRAVHADVGIEGRIGASSRWQMTVYDREDRNLVRLPDAENRIVNNTFATASLTSRYVNALDGHARGFEWLVHRQTSSGFSGWASYALSFARYHDRTNGETFWGDYDQRHTVNVYGNYRHSDRLSLSARFRAGSNFPTAGYFTERDGLYYQSSERNTLRIPAYSRLDVRMNRTFTWAQRRLTLFIEGINVLNQTNQRFQLPSVNRRTFEATGLFDSMVPIIPSIGLLLDF
jgi:Carboxypeptidase regulatory-like domain